MLGERIYRVAPEGGRLVVFTSARGYGPQESFDGHWVYFVHRRIQHDTADGFSQSHWYGVSSGRHASALVWYGNWTLVREGVYFFPAEDSLTLSHFDFATKRARPVFKAGSGVFFGKTVSPDGRYILYAQLAILEATSCWLMVSAEM